MQRSGAVERFTSLRLCLSAFSVPRRQSLHGTYYVCRASRSLPNVQWHCARLPSDGASEAAAVSCIMSRAFLRDDAEGEMPRRNYGLPERDDPEYDRVAARAMLEAARVGETQLAERATGYYWGEPALKPYVQELLAEAEQAKDDRLEQLARRFLK